jgi:hypothetical protein
MPRDDRRLAWIYDLVDTSYSGLVVGSRSGELIVYIIGDVTIRELEKLLEADSVVVVSEGDIVTWTPEGELKVVDEDKVFTFESLRSKV